MSDSLHLDPCNLCPRLCGANRLGGQRGVCGAADELRVARAALHYWEEPPISGLSGSGTVFFGGCPLHCVYCQNAQIAGGDVGAAISVERLAQICVEQQKRGALNVNFVTPTHYSLQIIDAVKRARELGLSIPVVWNTSGYERAEVIRALAGTVDVYLDDFKYASSDVAVRYSHVADYPAVALRALAQMVEQVGPPRFEEAPPALPALSPSPDGIDAVGGSPATLRPQVRMARGVIVRHLLLPGALDQSKQALRLVFENFGNDVLYSIMNQYTPVISGNALERFPELGARVPSEEYEELLDFADSIGLDEYFWQDSPADEASFIPAWNNEGVLE